MFVSCKDAPETSQEIAPDMLVADLDGTLTHVNAVTAKLASVSDRLDLSLSKALVQAYRATVRACDSLGVNRRHLNRVKENLAGYIAKEREDSFLVLTAAANNNIPCVLVSNGPEQWGNYMLKTLRMKYFFEKAVFREDMPSLKPDPRSLEPALSSVPKNIDHVPVVWIYGDRASDMVLAINANKVMPYKFVPVTVQGTQAAEAMETHPELKSCSLSIVFESQFAMACSLRPEISQHLKKYVDDPANRPMTIDSTFAP